MSASSVGDCATINWLAPTYLPPLPTIYQVFDSSLAHALNSSSLTATLCGLTLGNSYKFIVRGSNVHGNGGFSSNSNSVTITGQRDDCELCNNLTRL